MYKNKNSCFTMMTPQQADYVHKALVFVDTAIDTYLKSLVPPFLTIHETFCTTLNNSLRSALDANKAKIPDVFTPNVIIYLRTVSVIPCILLLDWGYWFLPISIVIFVYFSDFLYDILTQFWVDVKHEREEALKSKDKSSNPLSPAMSEDDSFEVVTTGSPQTLVSWLVLHHNRKYDEFLHGICNKAFLLPCWIALLHSVPGSGYLRLIQYLTLIYLILAETTSGTIQFREYFTSGGISAPKLEGFDFSTSPVKAEHVGKAKQSLEMFGTAIFILPFTRYLGLAVLILTVPLSYESICRKIFKRVMYVNGVVENFDHKTLKFWMQAKAMGSKLIVGIPGRQIDMVKNACACSSVDEVIAEAPDTVDLMFLEKLGVDYVVGSAGQAKFVTDETLSANRCLTIGEDGVAHRWKLKADEKDD